MQPTISVKEKYATMPDSELMQLAEEEYMHLTAEARILLDIELEKRKLVSTVSLKEKDNESTTQHYVVPSHVLNFLFDAGEYNKSSELIYQELAEMGVASEDAASLIKLTKSIAAQRFKKASTDLITGSAIGVSGIALLFLPINLYSNRLMYIVAGSAIIYGLFFYIRGWYNKGRFKKIIRNL